jgi:hypothetical protein
MLSAPVWKLGHVDCFLDAVQECGTGSLRASVTRAIARDHLAPIFVERTPSESESREAPRLPAVAATYSDRADSERLEALVERGFEALVEVGSALAEIRDRGLHSPALPTFEQYCRERLGMHPAHVRRLISALGRT